ncbi:MAG: DDE-type integrase/transposase/recombinase [Planctomycetota bacterium]|nr:DDE-type integrase/transposase/recombinase [Planctomycetota bacterium]
MTCTRGWAACSINARIRLTAENDRLKQEVQLLREELRIKDVRLAKIDPRRRPYYPPAERMAILALKAARGWSLAQAARAFLVDGDTIAAWGKRIDEDGSASLVQLSEPVNKFPDFVRHVVQRLKVLCPQILARAGLHVCATTVGRMVEARTPSPKPTQTPATQAATDAGARVVTARRPNHVWHVDLTAVPVGSGFWTAWLPFSLPQCWPFCWWVAVVVDHFSRRAMGTVVFPTQPDGRQVRRFLDRTIRQNKAQPKYVICDKGGQFWCKPFKRWCRRRGIKSRFGAVGRHGSIAVIERFIRTLKGEGLRRILVPLNRRKMSDEVIAVAAWYNTHRPHTALSGRTPEERYRRIPAACRRPRWEPRPHWPATSPCAAPQAKLRGKPGARLQCPSNEPHLQSLALTCQDWAIATKEIANGQRTAAGSEAGRALAQGTGAVSQKRGQRAGVLPAGEGHGTVVLCLATNNSGTGRGEADWAEAANGAAGVLARRGAGGAAWGQQQQRSGRYG